MTTYSETLGEMDIIFAGGGTAACVAAGRLAKANPDLKILLIEGGRNNFEDPTVVNPAVYLSHLAPDSKTALVSLLYFLKSHAANLTDSMIVLQV
jgi:alcohol oxidase